MKHPILIICVLATLFVGCKEKKELEWIVEDLSKKKAAVQDIYGNVPYQESEHQSIAEFFRASVVYSERLEVLLEKAKRKSKRKARPGRKQGTTRSRDEAKLKELGQKLPILCEKIVLDLDIWKSISISCEINGYFVCNEEVRSFPVVVDRLLALSSKIQPGIEYGGVCSEWADRAE